MIQPWKTKKCGTCVFRDNMPGSEYKPIDLAAPKMLICRHSPPQIVYAIAARPNQPPQPMPLGSMYPMIFADNPACAYYQGEVEVDMSKIGVP
jgi:hypothetical protein